MDITDYLRIHSIVKIGHTLPNHVCCETIVDDPIEFISVVCNGNYYISEIRWWDRVKITEGSDIGYGGTIDPRFPNEFFFAETDLCQVFSPFTKEAEYKKYVDYVFKSHTMHDLHPAFDIKSQHRGEQQKQ